MSGKPTSVGASRAGVAGAPRVLVYVADPRQIEATAAGPEPPPAAPFDALYLPDAAPLPRAALFRHPDHSDQRNPPPLFYKHFNDDAKLNSCVTPDHIITQRDYYPVSQQFKEAALKLDENKSDRSTIGVKRDGVPVSAEINSVETFHSHIPIDSGEPVSYQQRCSGSADNMPSMVPLGSHHGQGQFNDCVVQNGDSDSANCSEKEQSVGKSYVNYQFLEQSVSHQSIVNQSINILNQQVGVSRSIVSEGDGGAPQLVRTPEGVVLAVLPPPVLPHASDTDVRLAQSEPQTINVPLGWRRIVNGTSVLYVSPSGTALSTLPQLRDYLQTTGTCKCGLPCPLRPETAFNFDPKVVSKPYQAASGAELTKLCNHKRKLLANLQARAQSPATPPPQTIEQKKVSVEVTSKKKMKKRTGLLQNMSVSQMMVQRERPLNEFKPHDNEPKRTDSPGAMAPRPSNIQTCVPTFTPVQQNVVNVLPQDHHDVKHDTLVQRSSHYLTVNSGWITQQSENVDTALRSSSVSLNQSLNVGLPVLGTNGQIIGVNTGFNKQPNVKNVMGLAHNNLEHESRDEKNVSHTVQQHKHPNKDEEAQIFCGLNQPLTPEVMQKINEQQQLFIQQNQKQIEVMKGFKTQFAETSNQSKGSVPNQYLPQGQLVIQNGAVVKTNSAKTPPWQVKRNDSNVSNALTSPKPQKQDNIDYEDASPSVSDESTVSFSSFSNNEHIMNQAMCSRVPPLPQHYNMLSQQWPAIDVTKKKQKGNSKGSKKKSSPPENKSMAFGNNGMRIIHDPKGKVNDEMMSVPSFMDDPNGYLAQQTVLLNNTISRQVGLNTSYDNSQFESSSNLYPQNNSDKSSKSVSKQCEPLSIYRSNVPSSSPSPNNTPDSSLVQEKTIDNSVSQCCKGCNISYKGNCTEYSENQMRHKFMKQNMYGMELDGNPTTSSPKHNFDENPVTSSTFMERSLLSHENCGPIQAGIVSTSNVSPTETLQPPEPSPTLSNSSRSTDTPHSHGSNNSQMLNNCTFPTPNPAYSNTGSCKDNFNSNPSTPCSNQMYPYNSPGPPISHTVSGTQMMHFISNHNVNKNLMEVDNISMVGVKPVIKAQQEMFRPDIKKRIENSMPGYCPPPHLGGGPAHSLIQACYVQTFVTTMASGFSVTRDTVTSVLAGKANTATTSINASQANFIRPPPPPSVNLATTYAIPNNQPDPFINSVNLPTSYPLHIAGTTAQNMISKSPLEMVQNVISSLPSKPETTNGPTITVPQINRRTCSTTPGQILISSTGQIIVSTNQMPPPPPKNTIAMSQINSNAVTNVTTSVTQVVPAVGGVSPIVNQPTVVVNTLPAPFVIQPPMMAVDGAQVVQQNTVLPQIVTGGIVPGQSSNESPRQIEVKNGQSYVQGVAMLSPESLKKRNKKKKNQANITNVLQITAPQQNPNNIMVHHSSPQHSSPQFSPRGFQLSPTNNISPTPMLQALTIVPGKSGTPAHIVMNGQGNANNFSSQQIIANTSPSQQINLLQPVNLINNANSVMSNFPAFQQFIVPNIGGMVMTADGTAIIQDSSTGMPMQLQLQTVNGQNVLTPVQNPNMFAGTNSGVVIRAQNQQGKIIQSQHSPGAQFLSPNSQVMMSSPNFNGQLSPLLANLSPTNVTFNTSPHQVRSGNIQTQEFMQTNQMGQTLMVPLSPKQVSIASATSNRSNSTIVQQNTTIVQQQTTLVSNSHNSQMSSITTNLQGSGTPSRLSIDPNVLLAHKQITTQKGRNIIQVSPENNTEDSKEGKQASPSFIQVHSNENDVKVENAEGYGKFMNEFSPLLGQGSFNQHVRHSVSTQTLVNQQRGKSPSQIVSGSSPPDTTTHSPLGALETASSPRVYGTRCMSTQGNYADTTTKSPEPADINSSAMVQCVSSSEQDMAESRERAWPTPRTDLNSDSETPNVISNIQVMRPNRAHNSVESTEIQYGQGVNASVNSQHNMLPMTSNYYECSQGYKRKNDFGDGSTYRPDKIMRTTYGMVHGIPKDPEYDGMGITPPDKQTRHFPPSGTTSETSTIQKVFDRHLGAGDDSMRDDEAHRGMSSERPIRRFEAGDLVWGPVKGYASWPGKLERRCEDGRWCVRWFGGDKAPGVVEHARLLTLSEGLEAHHAARTKHRKSRKLNTLLENAIQEAMAELDKKSERLSGEKSDSVGFEDNPCPTLLETPKRSKKPDKIRNKDKHSKKIAAKIEGTRLRSTR